MIRGEIRPGTIGFNSCNEPEFCIYLVEKAFEKPVTAAETQ